MATKTIATSARYRPDPSAPETIQVQVAQGRFDTSLITSFYDTEGDVKLGPITGTSTRSIEDTHFFAAEFTPSTGAQNIAYGWNAGGNDSHYRVFNAEADVTTADAWYGYVPNPYGPGGSTTVGETPDLDLSNAADAGMICNWAGPGNSHNVNNYLQHQSMTKNSEDRWVLTTGGSLIRYVPTVSCELASNTDTAFTAVANGGSPHAASLAANDIAATETFIQSDSASIGLDDQSNHNLTVPDVSW
jgi:hypothetical protein